ncbi:hypothetical protein [Mesorhizobium sp. M0036]|uniref:hypothetical protein n=1 Tax=Mesorhizobium sp. M0036 TaxID=2956853 RepID=UPI00333DCE61
MTVPALDHLLASREIKGFEAAVLAEVWRGKGMRVASERLWDAMYADDPDGGPASTQRMYADLRGAIYSLNTRLNDSGISVLRDYRSGFRLALKSQNASWEINICLLSQHTKPGRPSGIKTRRSRFEPPRAGT